MCVCVCVECLGGTAGYRGGVLIGLMVARVNRTVIGWFCLCAHPVLEPSRDAAVTPSEVWSGRAVCMCVYVCACVYTRTSTNVPVHLAQTVKKGCDVWCGDKVETPRPSTRIVMESGKIFFSCSSPLSTDHWKTFGLGLFRGGVRTGRVQPHPAFPIDWCSLRSKATGVQSVGSGLAATLPPPCQGHTCPSGEFLSVLT